MKNAAWYVEKLKNEFSARCRENARYSLRAFARAMDLDPSILSRVLAEKRHLSSESAAKAAAALKLDPTQEQKFLVSAANAQYGVRAAPKCEIALYSR